MRTTNTGIELTDELLGAYADGELTATAQSGVEAALLRDAQARARLAAIRDVSRLVRAATYRQAANRPAPRKPRPARRFARTRRTSVLLAASFIGGALAVTLALQLLPGNPAPTHGWQQSTLAFYSSYLRASAEGKSQILIDVQDPSSEQSTNVYAPLIDYEPVLPDLSDHDYAPTGSRLVISPDGPTVFVVYEAPGRSPVGFSVIRATHPHRATPTSTSWNDVHLVSWSDGEFEYALSSEMEPETLSSIAATARESLGAEPVHQL